MRNILVRGFPSLDNYGTGMMGLITIYRMRKLLGDSCRFHCDFFEATDIDEVVSELDGVSADMLVRHRPDIPFSQNMRLKALGRSFFRPNEARNMDLVLMLGGDDISEYYGTQIWRQLVHLRHMQLAAPVILLGQTIGPFARRPNRLAASALLPAMHIFPRDLWCTAYLRDELGVTSRVQQSTDLAYADLPLQHRTDIAQEILAANSLEPDCYATMIVSGLGAKRGAGHYTSDADAFIQRHADMATQILARPDMAGKKLCLLAHTHGRYYGDEAANIEAVAARLAPGYRARCVLVTERVLQTRARFLLGHGLFTLTGRMHPAVSTFQMGKPAISLAYSKKYEGVIGTMLGRSDLIIDANDEQLWTSGEIVDQAMTRVDYAMANHDRLCAEISAAIDAQKATVDATFARIGELLSRP
ncbi:MAG: polysaccharide pyruvyl transferase family protein [Polymorphobacter sp.]|uniref:polysaccharide pyruvyl transferase family protein n=1 Tax=Polymorphobacter sp. TaxID=1909290 RepID=UPI003A89EDE9